MSKMLLWEKIDLPFMLTMDRKSWQLCAIPPLACSAVLVFLPSLLVCATTLVIPMLLYKSYPSLLVRMHKPWSLVNNHLTFSVYSYILLPIERYDRRLVKSISHTKRQVNWLYQPLDRNR